MRTCSAYRSGQPSGQPKAEPIQAQPKAQRSGFDLAQHVRSQVEAQEGRLRLRELEAAHSELDQKEAARERRAGGRSFKRSSIA